MKLDDEIKSGLLNAIGKKIKSIRKSKKFSQAKLSTESGIHTTYISKIESGIANPSFIVLCQIAWALNITLKEVFSDKKKTKRNKVEDIQKIVDHLRKLDSNELKFFKQALQAFVKNIKS